MQPIAMPAWRLTADCIWNSFRSSGKRHLLLTGSRGSGKTTLLNQLRPESAVGLTSWVIPGKEVRLRENASGTEMVIGRADPHCNPPMTPVLENLRQFGVTALERCGEAAGRWVTVDEIGFLETVCPEYCDALTRLMARKQVLAAVRKQNLPFLHSLLNREDAFVIDMDDPFGNTACVIMASGLGRRFGGNKLMADFHGQPLLARVLQATDCIPHRVVVTRHADVAAYCRAREIPTLLHAEPWRSDTVRLGLEALPEVERCIFCPGDQPLLREETLMSLSLLAGAEPECILRPAAEGIPGAPILFPRCFFPELLHLPEGKGGSFVAKAHPEAVRLLPIPDARELWDADTPEALERLRSVRLTRPPF